MIERLIKSSFPKKISFFLFGPRQTGKSTLVSAFLNPETTVTIDLLKTEGEHLLSDRREPCCVHRVRRNSMMLDEVP